MHVNAKHGFHGCENGGWILFLFSFSILSQHETGTPRPTRLVGGRRAATGVVLPDRAATPRVRPCLRVAPGLSQGHCIWAQPPARWAPEGAIVPQVTSSCCPAGGRGPEAGAASPENAARAACLSEPRHRGCREVRHPGSTLEKAA